MNLGSFTSHILISQPMMFLMKSFKMDELKAISDGELENIARFILKNICLNCAKDLPPKTDYKTIVMIVYLILFQYDYISIN